MTMALEQHLGDAGCAAEVAVNLERRMGIEHIRIGTSALFDATEYEEGVSSQRQLVLDEFIGVLAVQ